MDHLAQRFIAATFLGLTDFTTGPFAITLVLKLNGPAGVVSLEPFCIAVVGSTDRGSELKEAFVGLSRFWLSDSKVALLGNVSFSGDKESRSMETPPSSWVAYWTVASSDGGVGVRGGTGRGRFDAISTTLPTHFPPKGKDEGRRQNGEKRR